MKETIVCVPAKLGDGLLALPVADWLYRERGQKIHFVLAGGFNPFNYLTPLLMLQPMTSRVSVVPHQYANYDCGGQPKDYNPADYGIEGEYYCLGFRGYPSCFVPEYYGQEFGFGYTKGYRLNLFDHPIEGKTISEIYGQSGEILRSTEGAMAKLMPHATPMGTHEDLLTLARRMAAAKEVHLWMCGLAILNAMAGTRVTVHRVPGHAQISLYYEPDQYLGSNAYITFIEHQEDEIR